MQHLRDDIDNAVEEEDSETGRIITGKDRLHTVQPTTSSRWYGQQQGTDEIEQMYDEEAKVLDGLKNRLLAKAAISSLKSSWDSVVQFGKVDKSNSEYTIEDKLPGPVGGFVKGKDFVFYWDGKKNTYQLFNRNEQGTNLSLYNIDKSGDIIKFDDTLIKQYMTTRLLVLPVALFAAAGAAGVGAWQLGKKRRYWK